MAQNDLSETLTGGQPEEMNPLLPAAMLMILKAGDARANVQAALDALAGFRFEEAEAALVAAKADWVEAHHSQTDIIQEEMSGERTYAYSMLFAHAQDTLMTVNSELLIAEKLSALFRAMDQRYQRKEAADGT